MAYKINGRPRTPEELFRTILDRLSALENARSVRVGDWGLKQDTQGRVVAVHSVSGAVVVVADEIGG